MLRDEAVIDQVMVMVMVMMMMIVVVVVVIHRALCFKVGVCVLVVLVGREILVLMAKISAAISAIIILILP